MSRQAVHSILSFLAAVLAAAGLLAAPAAATLTPTTAVSISAGSTHACAVTAQGGARCFGDNTYGMLGNGSTTSSSTPVDVLGLSGAVAVAAGSWDSCAIVAGGAVECWGQNNVGQLGNGGTTNSSTPVTVTGLTGAVAIGAGNSYACALTSGGAVYCWGWNPYGQLGVGSSPSFSTSPVQVTGLSSGVTAIGVGVANACAVLATGGVECWGAGTDGQNGNNTLANAPTPVTAIGITNAKSVAAYNGTTCAVLATGSVDCWGEGGNGQLGTGSSFSEKPVAVNTLTSGIAQIAVENDDNCVLTTGGAVECLGLGNYGVLGDGSDASSTSPVAVTGLASGVSQIAAGPDYACALLTAGDVKCWGRNAFGQFGDGTTVNAPNNTAPPVDVLGFQATPPPSVTVPADMTVEATGPAGAAVTYSASATDASAFGCSPASGSTFALGLTTVMCNATGAGGSASASFRVTVQDTTPPSITGTPTDTTVEATGPGGATVNYTTPTATDLVDGADPTQCAPASGSVFPLGPTQVICTAKDAAANSTSTTFEITVTDSGGTWVTVNLRNHLGAPLDSGSVSYYAGGSWHTIGDTSGGQTQVEMLPGSYSFAMVYNGTRQQLNNVAISGTNTTVTFQTDDVTVQLEDHAGKPLDTGTASYYAGSWHTIGDTSGGQTQVEMLPGSYSFAMVYTGTRQQLNNVAISSTNTTVTFQRTDV